MIVYFLGCGLFFLASILLTAWARRNAVKKSIMDIPNQRSSHKLPTPRGGGLGFIIVFYLGLMGLWIAHFLDARLVLALLGGIPLAYIGHLDDVHGLSPRWRFLVQILVSAWGIAWLGGVHTFDWQCAQWSVPVVGSVIAVITTVWFINLYNFMDGIDGLAGLEGIFVFGVSGAMFLYLGSPLAPICWILVAGLAGFLVWNWPPAKIFMGDIGSGFIGYVIALLMWASNNAHQLPIPFWIILLALFFFDTFYTLVSRMLRRQKIYTAHREHAYQCLVQTGWKHWHVTVAECIVNIVLLLPIALLYFFVSKVTYALLIYLIIMSLAWLAWYLIRCRKAQEGL